MSLKEYTNVLPSSSGVVVVFLPLNHSFSVSLDTVHAEILCFSQLALYPVTELHAVVLISLGIDIEPV